MDKWQERNLNSSSARSEIRRSAPARPDAVRSDAVRPDAVRPDAVRSAQDLTSIRFAQIARQLNNVAKEHGLRTPAFRSPPRTPGLRRSIKRRPDGSATVSVSLRGRPAVAVVADMIDGVIAANEPGSTRSAEIADRLWSAATPLLPLQDEPADDIGAPSSRAA